MRFARFVGVLLASAVVASSSTANAQVFTNPLDAGATDAGAYSQTNQVLAGGFSLASATGVTGASWYGVLSGSVGNPWSFDVVFRAGGATPGAVIATRSVSASVFDAGFTLAGEAAYQFTTSFAAVNLLGATDYYFSAINTGTQNTFRWTKGTLSSNPAFYSTSPDTWLPLEEDRAPLNFALYNDGGTTVTPEPASLVLVAAGLFAVAGVRRRIRR